MKSKNKPHKPEPLTRKHIVFLDNLQKTNAVNMMAAAPYLQDEFDCASREAHKILLCWIRMRQ
ncbi:MAG TPA: hypothetical protein ENJ30_13650 [Desulfobulbaceae bacterium]|nr:hypothetical protein [Desulfobulbaceae bacterium]